MSIQTFYPTDSTFILLLTLCLGCQGSIGKSNVDSDFSVGARRPVSVGGGDDDGGGGQQGGGAQSTGGSSSAMDACAQQVFESSSAPLRRLTELEYRNTVGDLFPGVMLDELGVPPDARLDGFTNTAAGQASSSFAVTQYATSATAIAEVAAADMAAWAPCSAQTESCVRQALSAMARRLYRRPLSAEEQGALTTMIDALWQLGTPQEALESGLAALLQSPKFLYRPEFGTANTLGAGAVTLTGYEMATRLSYYLLATAPGEALLAAARDGELDDAAGVRAQAQRLFADPRTRAVVTEFFVEWLRLYKLDELSLDPAIFPEFDSRLREDLRDSARAYVEHALWDLDSWSALMTGSYGYVNDRLAPLFGVAPPGSDSLQYVELDASERRGILTQPSLLASTSHGIRHSPILRGVTMLDNILCRPPPPPPPGVVDQAPDLTVNAGDVCTTRDDVALTHTANGVCFQCHESIDGAGFNFENYDALGRYRSTENGCEVDATGTYPGTDLMGEFQDAVALAQQLPASTTVTECAAQHLFRYGLGRKHRSTDRCEISVLGEQLRAESDSLQQLVLNLVVTPSFRSRPNLQ